MRDRLGATTQESKGAMLILASTAAFCVMSALVRYASDIDPYKTTLFRFVIGLGILGTAALFGRIKLRFTHGPLLFLRGLFGGTAILIFFWSIPKLGVGKATVLIYSFPIFGSLFSAIFLNERVGLAQVAAMLVAFGGVGLLASDHGRAAALWSLPGRHELVTIVGAMLGGIALVLVKKLHDTDSSYAIFFAQCVIGLWVVVVPANVVPCAIGWTGGLLLVAIGVTSAVGQLLSTEGYRYLPVMTGSLLGMLVPVLNYAAGVTMFGEPISARSLIGSAAVLGASVVALRKNKNLSER
ncbi:MAG: DMT family transporter [Phycisphaerales bacterium]|nr:MAG: DMT family transporter [Phycisphaerales bacterium]